LRLLLDNFELHVHSYSVYSVAPWLNDLFQASHTRFRLVW